MMDESLRFFGSVTASVTHQLNNVISIIEQTSGLVQDMVISEKSGTPLNIDRLSKAMETTSKQTNRGLEIIRRLNRFAHSADEPNVEFDVPEVIENLVAICSRFAELKRALIDLRPPSTEIRTSGNPFLFQAAVFRALRAAIDTAQPNDAIRASIDTDDSSVVVVIQCQREIVEVSDHMTALKLIMEEIEGRIDAENGSEGTVLKLVFPRPVGARAK